MSKSKKDYKWTLSWDSNANRYVVRRGPKQERYPAKEYKKFNQDKSKMEEFVNKLNYRLLREEERKKNWKIQTSFLKTTLIGDAFYNYIYENTRNEKYSMGVVSRVRRYFVDYFTGRKMYDYIEWQTLKSQRELVSWLLKKNLSIKTIDAIKQNINQFYQFLHEESDGEIDLYKVTFFSLKKAVRKKHEKERIKKNKHKDRRLSGDDYIDEETFKKIIARCKKGYKNPTHFEAWTEPKKILPYIWLSYYYGLRRSETIAVNTGEIKHEYLRIVCQQDTVEKTMPLKHGHDERCIPHYNINNLKVLKTVLNEIKVIHPSSLTKIWGNLMKDMGLKFTYHNIRNSYCSNLFRDMNKLDISPAHIQLAMGHDDIRTTMKYLRDFRKMGNLVALFDEDELPRFDEVI